MPGRRPYAVLTLAGFAFWMGALHWLRLPHWATSFGWVALSLYFALYLPAFVGIARVAVHRFRMPVLLAAPTVWTGLELARAHLLSGMSMADLAHTQYRWVALIQVSDLAGEFGVSFLVMFVAAALARCVPCGGRRWCVWPVLPAAVLPAPPCITGTSGRPTNRACRARGSRWCKARSIRNCNTKKGAAEQIASALFGAVAGGRQEQSAPRSDRLARVDVPRVDVYVRRRRPAAARLPVDRRRVPCDAAAVRRTDAVGNGVGCEELRRAAVAEHRHDPFRRATASRCTAQPSMSPVTESCWAGTTRYTWCRLANMCHWPSISLGSSD